MRLLEGHCAIRPVDSWSVEVTRPCVVSQWGSSEGRLAQSIPTLRCFQSSILNWWVVEQAFPVSLLLGLSHALNPVLHVLAEVLVSSWIPSRE